MLSIHKYGWNDLGRECLGLSLGGIEVIVRFIGYGIDVTILCCFLPGITGTSNGTFTYWSNLNYALGDHLTFVPQLNIQGSQPLCGDSLQDSRPCK